MGMETAAIVMVAVTVAAEAAKSAVQAKAASVQEHALDVQAKELELKHQQKTLTNYDVLKKVVESQIAHQTVTGTAFSSPSFNAIQRHTVNIAAKRQMNSDIEGGLEDFNNEIAKENVRNTLYAQLFGNAAETASTAFSVYSKMPSKGE